MNGTQIVQTAAQAINPWRILGITSLAIFLVFLDTTILFVAFGDIRASFSGGAHGAVSWVLNAYTILYAALLVPSGRLADLYGRRRVFMLGLGIFTLASILCGLSASLYFLIAMRCLQAIGGAMLIPASLGLVLAAFPENKRPIAVSLWGAVAALAGAIGPALGAIVVERAGWPWIFYINVPVALFVWLKKGSLVESTSQEQGALPDFVGIALLAGGISAVVGAFLQYESWRLRDCVALFGAGLILITVFVVWASNAKAPALDLSMFKSRNYRLSNLASLIFGATFTMMFFGLILFATQMWHFSLSAAGLAVTPGPLTVIPVAFIAGKAAARIGHRPLLVAGSVIYTLGAAWLYMTATATPHFFTVWLPGVLLTGVGVGLIVPSLSGSAVFGLAPARFAVGSAVNQALRQIGGVFGVVAIVVLVGDPSVSIEKYRWVFVGLMGGALATGLLSLGIDTKPKAKASSEQKRDVTAFARKA